MARSLTMRNRSGGYHENSGALLTGLSLLLSPALAAAAGFSRPADPADRAVSGRRPQRHHRARGRPAHVGTDQAAGRDRQSRRPGRRARNRRGGEGQTRRLHHRDLQRGRARHQPQHGKGRLRPAEGSAADHAGRESAGDAGGRHQRSRQQHEANWSRSPRRSPANSILHRPAPAACRIWPANCSSSPPRSTSCMCPIAVRRRPSTICWASRCRWCSSICRCCCRRSRPARCGRSRSAPRERAPTAMDVPTTAEVGMPDLLIENWYGMVAPAGTPPAIVAALNRIAIEAMRDPAVKEKLASQGADAGRRHAGAFPRLHRQPKPGNGRR